MNLININKSHKNLSFYVFFTKKNMRVLKFLKTFNIIHRYILIKKNKFFFIKIYVYYFQNKNISSNFKIISKPSKKFLISYKALRLLSKKCGSSVFILSTNSGIVSHTNAVLEKKGGVILASFSL